MRIATVSRVATTLLAGTLLLLTGCGGSSSSGSSDDDGDTVTAPAQTGTVGIMITDAPTDEFDQVLITIEEARLIGANGEGSHLMFEGSETLDLLALTEFTELFVVADDVPVGDYEKIRLQVSNIELVELGADDEPVRVEQPRITGNGKLDLNPRGTFTVEADQTLLVRLDLDARKSVLVVGSGQSGQYIFRPVVFVDIDRGDLDDRLVRLFGEVESVDADAGEIELCDLRRIQSDNGARAYEGCILVRLDDLTGLFDDQGEALTLASLMAGELATATGFFAPRENATQPFDALVVQVGDRDSHLSVAGTAVTEVDLDARFTLLPDPGQGFTDEDLAVALSPGTALITRTGERLEQDAIKPGRDLHAEGVFSAAIGALKASLVVLASLDVDSEDTLRGIVQTVDATTRELVVSVEDPASDVCVVVVEDADVFRVSELEDGGTDTERADFDALESGQSIDAWGRERSDGCFEATTVIINLDGVDGNDD